MGLDKSQLRAIYDTHGPMVFRRARRILGNDADAEEAVQEVFIRAFSAAERFEERSSVATWLHRITTHWCLNKMRDRRRRTELWDEKIDPAEPRATEALSHPEILALRRVLAAADEREAQAAVCVFLDGMSHDEASEVLGVSRRTVGNLLERFATFARKMLADPRMSA
ncbi:MAG: sigma-70 family RNA polymerase sigma factor [Deltaproteobacteria bacterium]|nr:sigma-70 family RNA polymerase sigma factor [Deltaproteobacteria bacterium]